MEHEFCIVLTTTDSKVVKDKLVEHILRNNLAACIQTVPIESHYVWEESICHDEEILISIKTRKARYKELEGLIEEHHNYDVPQIVQIPVTEGFEPYLSWIRNTT